MMPAVIWLVGVLGAGSSCHLQLDLVRTLLLVLVTLLQVVSPNIYNFDLWKTSGHADHYRENMFSFDVEKQEYGLKPMNCPGHCVMFASRTRSYR